MVKLEVCIGTACHLKGSREVIETFQELIMKNNLKDKVDMAGKFCLGKCEANGVAVALNGEYFNLLPADTAKFFDEKVLPLAK